LRKAIQDYGKVNLRGVERRDRPEAAEAQRKAQRGDIRKLIDKGANPLKQSSKANENALHKAAQMGTPSGRVLSSLMQNMNAEQQKSALLARNTNGEQPAHLFMKQAGTLALQAKLAGERADKLRQDGIDKYGEAFNNPESANRKTRTAVGVIKDQIKESTSKQMRFQADSDGFKQQAEALNEHGKKELELTEESQQSLFQQRTTSSGRTPQDMYEAAQSPEARRAFENDQTLQDSLTESGFL
jgi:hypothetical protein